MINVLYVQFSVMYYVLCLSYCLFLNNDRLTSLWLMFSVNEPI